MSSSLRSRLRLTHVTPDLVRQFAGSNVRRMFRARPESQVVLAILGCQRSGTSAMSRMFFRDSDCVVYREKSRLTGGPEGLRYKPFNEVARQVSRKKASLIVFKMLVESQRALEFLDTIPNGRAIWLFRNYRDVASSNLRKFGTENGIRDLRPFLKPEPDNWRSQNCSEETIQVVKQRFSEEMNANDAAALFWYCRNRLFFEQRLDDDPRVLPVQYEDYVGDPLQVAQHIYKFVGLPYPDKKTTREINASSVRKGKQLELSPAVEALCEDMFGRLQDSAKNWSIAK